MSNVRISATGDAGLDIEIILGTVSRGKHSVNADEAIDLTVGGNQRLVIKESKEAGVTAKAADIPVGVDVSEEPDPANPENGEKGLFGNFFANADVDDDADAKVPVQGDLFGDNGADFDPEG